MLLWWQPLDSETDLRAQFFRDFLSGENMKYIFFNKIKSYITMYGIKKCIAEYSEYDVKVFCVQL